MPLPRRKDDGSSGAVIMDLLKAHVKLSNVEEYTEPRRVVRESDGREFIFDPSFECRVTVIDDGDDGEYNSVSFLEGFKYKNTKKDKTGDWILQENSKLGQLAKTVKPGYFEDASIPDLSATDLEGFELVARVKPKKNPNTGAEVGSTLDWETLKPVPKQAKPSTNGKVAEDSEEFEAGMREALDDE